MAQSLEALERQRAEILMELQALGDMRRGSIVEQYLKCGKTPCCCKEAGHPGHGPYFAFTRKVQGKTQTRQFRPGPALTKLCREVATFHRFRRLSDQLIEINERICELRPVGAAGTGSGADEVKKNLIAAVQAEIGQEIDRLVTRALKDQEALGHVDLEASEMAIRASMHQMGGALLEKLLNADGGGSGGARIDCGQGHQAEFIDYREKEVITVLSPVEVQRAYYHCAFCEGGVIPKDQKLDIVGTSFSPGGRRMMGRVGGKEPFDEGRGDLEALAGVLIKTKAVERVSEAIGKQIEMISHQEREVALSGKVVPLKAVPKLYIAIDGTGVPMVPHETEGRQGKDDTGKAKTREAKLGCVFTQTSLDDKGRPVRDEESTTYVGAIETAEAFGSRIYAEAVRRGVIQAEQVIVLGDGAPWIWGIADEHFHGAIQIVDLYHAREHLADLGRIVYGPASAASKEWAAARCQQLDAGEVEDVMAAMRRLRPREQKAKEEVRKAIDDFQTNAERMRYARFRSQGLFVGSGVVEAGCKTIVGQRLKQSGMRWTVRGANAIIALRCCQLSGRWEEFWEARSVG